MAPCYRNLKARGGFFCSSGGIQGRKKEAEKPWKSSLFPRNAWNPSPRCTPASVPTHTQKHVREGGWLEGWGGLQDPPASLRCFYTLCRCGQVQVGGGNVLCAFCVYNCLFYVCVWTGGQRGSGPSWTSWSCWLSWPEGRQSKRHTTSHDERWCVTQYCGYIMMSSHLIQPKIHVWFCRISLTTLPLTLSWGMLLLCSY